MNGVEKCIDDEIPFEIPESWEWAYFSNIVVFENGDRSDKYPNETDYIKNGIPFFGAKDMGKKYMDFSSVRFISKKKFNELSGGKLKEGDMICLLRGNVGKTKIFKGNNDYTTGFICAQMIIIRSLDLSLLEYLYIIVSSPYYTKIIESKTTGTAVKQLPAITFSKIFIPIPPLCEQIKIVNKINQLFDTLDI